MKFIGHVRLQGGISLLAVNGYFGQFNLLASDGLWVASLCHDNRYGPPAGPNTVWPENFSGWFYRHRDNGKVYLIAGDTDVRIWEVTGLDSIRNAKQTFTLTAEDHRRAVEAVQRRQGIAEGLAPLAMRRATPQVDGKVDDWDMSKAGRLARRERPARVALAYDDQYLYAAFDVEDDSPLRNSGKDPALLFKTGDACEVLLATDPTADPQRTAPGRGDLRLLLGVMEDRPLAVLLQPVAPASQRQPRTYSSPTGALQFDRVLELSEARVSVARRADGYVLEAAVPLAAIGLRPQPGATLRGDVGVIDSDAGGSRNVLRTRYGDQDVAIVNDIPSEARLNPTNWPVLKVE